MSLLKVNEIQIFNGTTVTITATTAEVSADLNVGADLDVTGALTLGTALAIAEGGTGATDAATARINLDVDQAGTDNSTDCTLVTTSHDYLSITGQAITLGPIDLAADVTGTLATSNGGTGVTSLGSLDAADLGSGAATDGYVLTADGAGGAAWEAPSGVSLPIDLLSSGASIRKSDGTTAVLSESGGAVTLENLANISLSGGIYFGTAGVTSGTGTETSNYLDDYEEGTWTPAFCDASSGGNEFSYTGGVTGKYTKIGNTVTVWFYGRTNGSTAGITTGNQLFIQGLPFAQTGQGSATYVAVASNTQATLQSTLGTIFVRLSYNGTSLEVFKQYGDVTPSEYSMQALLISEWEGGDGANITGSMTYITG